MEVEDLVNIDLQPVSDVANKLIDKIGEAVGFIFSPRGKYKYRIEAEELFIEEVSKDDNIDIITKSAIISNTRKILKEYKNQNDIVQIAIENLKKDAAPEKIDDTWILEFMDKCKNICDESAKIIWGKILAEESNQKGSMPRRVFSVLAYVDNEEAHIFEKICECSVLKKTTQELVPFIVFNMFHENFWSKYKFTEAQFRRLEEAGLIIYGEKLYTGINNGKEILILGEKEIEVHSSWKEMLYVGNVLFTVAGAKIASLLNKKENDGFENALFRELGYQNIMDMR